MKYAVCEVRVSELHTKQLSCPPWEVPILQAIHGNAVTVIGEREVDRDPPEPEHEYQRLATRYSGNKETPSTVVAQVYGVFEAGIHALEKAINDADTGSSKVSSAKAIADDLDARQKEEMQQFVLKQKREREERKRAGERLQHEQEDEHRHMDRQAQRGEERARARSGEPLSAAAIETRKREAREARARFESRQRPPPPARPPVMTPTPGPKK
jgi:hypothetical protein